MKYIQAKYYVVMCTYKQYYFGYTTAIFRCLTHNMELHLSKDRITTYLFNEALNNWVHTTNRGLLRKVLSIIFCKNHQDDPLSPHVE